ncbi:MAG: thioredoxin family protein [Flavobacteriaceae bacterium]
MDYFLTTLEDLENLKSSENAFVIYFTTDNCSVGEQVGPKVLKLIENDFPKIKIAFISNSANQELLDLLQLHIPPTLILFLESKEYLRKTRAFGLEELKKDLTRLYEIYFK